ncbi:MAG: glycosyltransferase family 9 protein [Bacteroidales bacterium]|nr:glycosyltransferase family 9 protein [Bacteroidales bacterium]
MPLTAIRKILVVRLSSIGDIILTTPLLRSLRKAYPQAHITFLIKKQFRELLEHSPYIDELVTFDKNEGMAELVKIKKELKKQQFDLYLDIHRNLRSRFLRYGLGARHNTTYHKLIVKRTLLIWTGINLYGKVKPVYERYFDSVRKFGIHYDGQGTEIHVNPDALEKPRTMLVEAGYDFVAPLVVICPSATYFNKRWLPEGFVKTAGHLIAEKNAFVVVHGGYEDIELCDNIAHTIGHRAVSMAGKLSLSGSAALLRFSSLVIANDTGLLHMAQSQKKPVVGIYGPTTRELGYFPVEQNSIVVETQVSCRPCTHNGLDYCPKKHFRCMKEISAESVIAAALTFLP